MAVSKKIDTNAEPIKDITYAATTGDLMQQARMGERQKYALLDALKDRAVDIFNKNGLVTKAAYVEGLDGIGVANIYPLTLVENAKTSHVLLLKAETLHSVNYQPVNVIFSALLIDVKTKKVVWKGSPLFNLGTKVNLQTQSMAGAIINSLNKDGLIHLNQESAIDLDGQPIKFNYPKWDYEGKDH